jgi:hypothetical protein
VSEKTAIMGGSYVRVEYELTDGPGNVVRTEYVELWPRRREHFFEILQEKARRARGATSGWPCCASHVMPTNDKPTTPFEPRSITPEEVAIVRTLLDTCLVVPVSPVAVEALPALKIMSRCGCGCASVEFVAPWPTEPRSRLVADGVATMPTDARVGLMVFGLPDAITAFEIYELDPYPLGTLPEPATIRSFFPTD